MQIYNSKLSSSGLSNILIFQCVASNPKGNCEFIVANQSDGVSGILSSNKNKHIDFLKNNYEVKDIKLNKVKKITIDILDIKKLDLVKIDVEGAEFTVIEGALKTII